MRYMRRLPIVFLFLLHTVSSNAETNSWKTFLEQSLDLSRLAAPVETWESSKHFSSASAPGKEILTHLAPEIMGDIDHGFFLRVDDIADGVEATLAEASGPGAITWIWSANPVGEVRLYVDDMKTPALAMSFQKFLSGKFLPHTYPFAAFTDEGPNLHFPFCHARYIRLTLVTRKREDLASLYYQVAWNALPPDSPVEPFSFAAIKGKKREMKNLSKQFEAGYVPSPAAGQTVTIGKNATATLLNAGHAGAITALEFRGRSRRDLSRVRLFATWDGSEHPAFDCTLDKLAGVSERVETARSLPAIVDGNRILLRWFMPFGPGSRIDCSNMSEPIFKP